MEASGWLFPEVPAAAATREKEQGIPPSGGSWGRQALGKGSALPLGMRASHSPHGCRNRLAGLAGPCTDLCLREHPVEAALLGFLDAGLWRREGGAVEIPGTAGQERSGNWICPPPRDPLGHLLNSVLGFFLVLFTV